MGFRTPYLAVLRRACYVGKSVCLWPQNRQYLPISRLPAVLPPLEHQSSTLISRRWHGGHSHDAHHHHLVGEGEKADGIFRLGLAADVALSVGKALTGYICGSTAIIADAAHSVSDVVLSSVALLSFRAAKAPKDKEHPYGHGKFESLGALGISIMLFGTAGGIAWHAFDVLQEILTTDPNGIYHTMGHHNNQNQSLGGHHHGIDLDHPVLALSMTFLSISVKEGLYWITKRAGEEQGSGLMKANAWHHRADAISSVVALVGVGGSLIGIPFLDPLAGIAVSGMILKAGIETGYQSVMELVDAGAPLTILAPIRHTITQVEGVKGCHRLRGRKAGSFLYLDVHIEVDPFLSVSVAHDIGENVRQQIQKSHNQVAEVFIHIDPSLQHGSSNSDQIMNSKGRESWTSNISKQHDTAAVVSNLISSLFKGKMTVEHITLHRLQGKVLLQVQVTLPTEMLIKDAMNMAREAEEEILKASSSTFNHVSILLRLDNHHLRNALD